MKWEPFIPIDPERWLFKPKLKLVVMTTHKWNKFATNWFDVTNTRRDRHLIVSLDDIPQQKTLYIALSHDLSRYTYVYTIDHNRFMKTQSYMILPEWTRRDIEKLVGAL